METYYQESGRAGRDGAPSDCLLLFRPGDVPRQSSMVFYENSGLQNLYDIVRYCQSKKQCRRSAFFRHFSEPLQDCNGMCDNCAFSSEIVEVDASGHAKLVVSLVQDVEQNDQRLTMLQLVDKLKIKRNDLGADLKREELEQLVIQLILESVLKEEFQHTAYATNAYIKTGPLARQVLQGKKTVKLEISSKQSKLGKMNTAKRSLTLSELESKLDKLRKELASDHERITPHAVLSRQQMSMIDSQKPKSTEELDKIIGKLKTEKYGNRILEEIKKFVGYDEPDNHGLNDEGSKNRTSKRQKVKDLVLIDSSDDN